MLHQPELVLGRVYLPELLQADTIFGRLLALVELESVDQLLGKRAARALCDQYILAEERHAARIGRSMRPVLFDAHVAGRDPDDGALIVIEYFRTGKARIDFNAEFFRFGAEPAADIAERYDEVTVIVHQRRHGEVGQADRA